MNFADVSSQDGDQFAPDVVVTLRPEHWLPSYGEAPPNPIKVGLRGLSLEDVDAIRSGVARAIRDAAEQGLEPDVKTSQLVEYLARAICHAKDARRGHDSFSSPNDLIPIALRQSTIAWLFDEAERAQVARSPIFSEATDDEISELCATLPVALAELEKTDATRASRVRRYLDFIATEIP